jgi:dienelactone hydrolase
MTNNLVQLILLAVVLSATVSRSSAEESRRSLPSEYVEARKAFKTRLVRQVSSPQPGTPPTAISGAQMVEYHSGDLTLSTYLSSTPRDGKKHPALLFLHGGFAFSAEDWAMAKPFVDAGFVVMMPILRGENGQPGTFTLFYNEVDDVLAAADRLAKMPNVDPSRFFIVGHSVGGTLALLAAMRSNLFHAAASFSGAPDASPLARVPQLVVFDGSDPAEFQIRSPLTFATSFKCATRLFYGSEEPLFAGLSQETARRAQERKLDVAAVEVPGDHFSAVPEEINKAITFFNTIPPQSSLKRSALGH